MKSKKMIRQKVKSFAIAGCLLLSGSILFQKNVIAETGELYYVSNDYEQGIAVRTGPGTDFQSICRLPYLTQLYVIEYNGDWGYVTYDGITGWMHLDYISPVGIEEGYEAMNEYILPQSSSEYLDENDIAGFSKQKLNYARNEIFARHDRLFASQELMDYFNTTSWYVGWLEPEEFDNTVLNEYERKNISFLYELECEDNVEGYVLDQPGYDIYQVFSSNEALQYGDLEDKFDVNHAAGIDYSIVDDFVFNFPLHGREEYALSGREEVHSEENMVEWLEKHGWTDYVNLYADSDMTSDDSPRWAYEAKNGNWNLSGFSFTEWHEKGDDDYEMGCNASIKIQCSVDEWYDIYETCTDILDDYYYRSYRDIDDDSALWSGFFDEDSAARLLYTYETSTISIVLYDSLQPNLYGVFWNGIPLQKDGVRLGVEITLSPLPDRTYKK